MASRILLTGSEPFAGLDLNPAQSLVERFARVGATDGLTLICRVLPVSYEKLPAMIGRLIEEVQPDGVISLGQALAAPVIRVETRALNWADFGVADNSGLLVKGEEIEAGGVAARIATWPAARIVGRLREAGIPASLSYNAGTHLCNLTLYTFLGALARRGRLVPCGFLHLPYLPEQVAGLMRARAGHSDRAPTAPVDLPSMSIDVQERAVRLALEEMAAACRRKPESAGVAAN